MDPYRSQKFEVEIAGIVRAGFSMVSGLGETTEDITYREGAENETPRHLPGTTSFNDITLSRGISFDDDFVNWRSEIFNIDNVNGEQGDNESFRRTVIIYLKDKSGARVKKWTVTRAWPKELSYEDLDANGNAVLVNSIILANEGQKMETV